MRAGCKAILVNPGQVKSKKNFVDICTLLLMGVDSTHMFPTSRGVNPATDLICSVLHHTHPFNSPVPDLVPLLGGESCPSTILQRSLDFNSFSFLVLSVPTADVGGWAPPLTRLKWIFGATEGRRPPALSLTMWTLILFICPPLPWWKPLWTKIPSLQFKDTTLMKLSAL